MNKTILSYASAFARVIRMNSGGKPSDPAENQPPNVVPLDISIPSSCFCVVKVYGPRLALEQFRKSASGFDPTIPAMEPSPLNCFCFGAVIPIDPSIVSLNRLTVLEQVRKGFWGTSGNAHGTVLKQTAHCLRYSFATFETYPSLVLAKLIKSNPHLKFHVDFENHQTGISGVVIGRNGMSYRWTKNLYAVENMA